MTGKNGIIGPICCQNAAKFYPAGQRADCVDQPDSLLSVSSELLGLDFHINDERSRSLPNLGFMKCQKLVYVSDTCSHETAHGIHSSGNGHIARGNTDHGQNVASPWKPSG